MQLRGEYHTQKSQDGSLVLLAGGKNIRSVPPLLQTTTEQEKGSLLSDVYDKGFFILMFSVLFSFVVSSRFVRSRSANDSSVNDTKNELEDNSSSNIEGSEAKLSGNVVELSKYNDSSGEKDTESESDQDNCSHGRKKEQHTTKTFSFTRNRCKCKCYK